VTTKRGTDAPAASGVLAGGARGDGAMARSMAAVALAAAIGSVAAIAASAPPKLASDSPDAMFLIQMARVGTMAVDLAHVAVNQATSEQVRVLAKRVLDDRSRIAHELQEAAQARGVRLDAPAITPYQQDTVDWISRLRDGAFDREYAGLVVLAADGSTERFREEADAGTDPALAALARKEVGALHADWAQAVRAARATRG
jgi:predicted outer membrane protein